MRIKVYQEKLNYNEIDDLDKIQEKLNYININNNDDSDNDSNNSESSQGVTIYRLKNGKTLTIKH